MRAAGGLRDVDLVDVDNEAGGPPRVHARGRGARPSCEGCSGPGWSKGERRVELVDLPAFGKPTRLVWHRGPARLTSMVDFQERLLAFKSEAFSSFRPSQQRVLQEYAANHLSAPDLAIEMPTGEGKTLVALLIADYALDVGRSVAYLTGTRQLADHVSREATRLGIDFVQFSSKQYGAAALYKYHHGQSVGIMNYWVYFNSKPVPLPADLLILDDAHLAEQPLTSLDTLRIDRRSDATTGLYESICDITSAHTNTYASLRAMRAGIADPSAPPELLSFQHWLSIVQPVQNLIGQSDFASNGDGRYVWQRIHDKLQHCCVVISASAIEIRPYHAQTTLNDQYAKPTQRLYLSATLGPMDDLQRRLGGNAIEKLEYHSTSKDVTTGKRRLVLNPTSDEALDTPILKWTLKQVEHAGGRAAWLCSSTSEADQLQNHLEDAGSVVFRLKAGNDSIVQDWLAAASGNLVTAGRYDGLDLIGDVCRLVIIPTVPRSNSELERFVSTYLGDASFMYHRIGQRITQALGRANRAPDDYALYLALDPRFGKVLAHPDVLGSMPQEIKSVVLSALSLHDEGMDETDRFCKLFWSDQGRDENLPDQTNLRRPRPGRKAHRISAEYGATDEITAVTELWIGSYRKAATAARRTADALADDGQIEHAAFWRYVEAHAHYCRGSDKDLRAATAALNTATTDAPRTSWFSRLERMAEELSGRTVQIGRLDSLFLAWDEWVRSFSTYQIEQRISRCRSYLLGTHDQRCESLVTVAHLSGAMGSRPKKSEQAATDCLWSWYSQKGEERRVWEVKTGNSDVVARSHIDQLLGQIEVESGRSGGARVSGCLVSPAEKVSDEAAEAARDRIALIHQDALVTLIDLLADRFRRYSETCAEGDTESRGEARVAVERLLPRRKWLEQLLKPSDGQMLLAKDVEDVFPRA